MTVSVPQDSNKRKFQSKEGPPPPALNMPVEPEGADVTGNRNHGVPPQSVPVRARLCELVEGWKHITNDPYVLSIVTKFYRLHFMSPPLHLKIPREIRSLQGPQKI